MRGFLALCLTLGLVLAATPAGAQDADALRRELEEMRRQFEAMKEQYQKSLDNLTERLRRLEAAPPAVAAPTPPRGTPSLVRHPCKEDLWCRFREA